MKFKVIPPVMWLLALFLGMSALWLTAVFNSVIWMLLMIPMCICVAIGMLFLD